MRSGTTVKLLFVCTANICRSPTVEAVFRSLLKRHRLTRSIDVDSAGTQDFDRGQPPDPRAVLAGWRRGYDLKGLRARRVEAKDFAYFDMILAMDQYNLAVLDGLRPPDYRGHLGLFLDFLPNSSVREVPDPYRGNWEAFEQVLDLAERGCDALLTAIVANKKMKGTLSP